MKVKLLSSCFLFLRNLPFLVTIFSRCSIPCGWQFCLFIFHVILFYTMWVGCKISWSTCFPFVRQEWPSPSCDKRSFYSAYLLWRLSAPGDPSKAINSSRLAGGEAIDFEPDTRKSLESPERLQISGAFQYVIRGQIRPEVSGGGYCQARPLRTIGTAALQLLSSLNDVCVRIIATV